MIKETKEEKAIKSELKELWSETKGIYKDTLEKYKTGELEAADVDKLTKILSSLRALKEIAYGVYDIATWKEKKDVELRAEDMALKKEIVEIKTEIEIIKMGG